MHWKLVKHIFGYLQGTFDYKLKFNRNSNSQFEMYVNADFGGDHTSKKSTTRYIIIYHNNPIHWRSKLQHSLAKSITEAEYLAIFKAVDDILFLARICEETLEQVHYSITIFENNTTCITQCERTTFRGKLKYMERKYLEKQKLFEDGILQTTYIFTKQQLADILTKLLSIEQFEYITDYLMFSPTLLLGNYKDTIKKNAF